MAQDDIELNIGVKFDENEFSNAYGKVLNDFSDQAKKYVTGALEEMKGAASKVWGQLPYYGMHDTGTGNARASQAFMASLAKDLPGLDPKSIDFESAMMNAVYRSSIPDAMQRYHQMVSQGYTRQADLTHPDTALGRTIETDYALMSQPWSRDFIRTGYGNLKPEDLKDLTKKELLAKAEGFGLKGLGHNRKDEIIEKLTSGAYVDFGSMRDYAVGAGLGRWIDPEKEHTADNFELISDELEKIEEKSDKTKKNFLNWHDVLKGVLGTLTAIGALAGVAIKLNKEAERTTLEGGQKLDRRRGFIGMSALDELRTKVASKAVGLGEDAVSTEIYNMSQNIEQYKLLGQGDALPSALLNIFDNMMSAEDPYSIYLSSIDEIYNNLKGADPATRRRWLMLMNKAGLGSASSIVGSFLSNPEYAKKYKTPSALFDLTANPWYGAYGKAEALTPDITKLNESIKASYTQMATDWENTFGVKFKSYWDNFLKEKVVPFFGKALNDLAGGETDEERAETKFNKAWNNVLDKGYKVNTVRVIEKLGYNTDTHTAAADAAVALQGEKWPGLPDMVPEDKAFKKKKGLSFYQRVALGSSDFSGSAPAFLGALQVLADKSNYQKGALNDTTTLILQQQADEALKWLEHTGLIRFLKSDLEYASPTSQSIMKVVRESLAAGATEGDATLDAFLAKLWKSTPEWINYIEPFLRENAQYLAENPSKVTAIKIRLFDGYTGKEISAMVDEVIEENSTVTNR